MDFPWPGSDYHGGSEEGACGMSDERDDTEQAQYDLMMELDQLESLKEEMEELGVSTIDEIEARMRNLHQKLDSLEQG